MALSVPSHLRKDAGYQSNSVTFDPAVAIALDAAAPAQRSSIPYRAFCRSIHGEPGVIYYFGGLHSNYAGNETDRIDLRDIASSTVTLTLNHQPRIPPKGPESGYSAGSGSYLYRQYGTPLADGTDWQPYSRHTWCQDTWHPDWGYLIQSNYARGNGLTVGANPAGSGTQYQQSSSSWGLVAYNWATNKYTVALATSTGHYGDFDPSRKSIISLANNQHSGQFYEWPGGSNSVARLAVNLDTLAPPVGVYSGSSGNGHLIRYLEPGRYLWYFPADSASGKSMDQYHRIYVYDVSAGTTTRIPIPASVQSAMAARWPNGDMLFSFAVDRQGRRVFWCAVDGAVTGGASVGPLRVWVSYMANLSVWTEVNMTNVPTVTSNMAYDREPLKFYNGFLFYLSQSAPGGNGDLVIHRMKVDANAEVAPRFNFNRHKQGAWNFSTGARGNFTQSKHCNWAYRSVDGRYYQIAGDVLQSYTQSMASVSINASTHSFRDELDETTPAPAGYVRPASPDDGAWGYCGAANGNAALADKFVYFRGGDGLSPRSNVYMQSAYATDTAAQSDRWTAAKAVIYDPVNRRFSDARVDQFALVQGSALTGGDVLAHPAGWSAAASRGGCWDPATNTMFKLARAPTGNNCLLAWRFDQREVRIWMCSFGTVDGQSVDLRSGNAWAEGQSTIHASRKWWHVSGTTGNRLSTLHGRWEHQNQWVNPADGKFYVVSPVTGLLWCFETRGAETNGSSGLQIPFYPVGNRIPLDDDHFKNKWDVEMHSYLVPFKGGLLYTCDAPGGNNGLARYGFWRRLGYEGDWTPITLPQEWACNSFAPKSQSINNDEIFAIGSGGGAGVDSPWFFLVS